MISQLSRLDLERFLLAEDVFRQQTCVNRETQQMHVFPDVKNTFNKNMKYYKVLDDVRK